MTRDIVLELYEDEGGKWRWRLIAGNGRITAASGESFAKKGNALRAAERLGELIVGADVLVVK